MTGSIWWKLFSESRFSTVIILLWTSSDSKWDPSNIFSFGNRKISHGIKQVGIVDVPTLVFFVKNLFSDSAMLWCKTFPI